MDLVTSSRGESLPVGQASEIQLRIQVGSPYPHTIVRPVYDSTKRCEAQQAERPSASPARDVEHSAGATASRLPLFIHPHPTALQLHAATAHTDVERLLLSARCWHGFAMTGANGKLFAAADIKRSDLVPDRLRCSGWLASGLVSDYRGHGPAPVGRTAAIRTAPASTGGMATQSGVAHGQPTSCDDPTRTHTHMHTRTRTHTHTHVHTSTHAHARTRTRTHERARAPPPPAHGSSAESRFP